jgi:8-oxo-dGTP pyrophosphatase MutT (NUDIX family)
MPQTLVGDGPEAEIGAGVAVGRYAVYALGWASVVRVTDAAGDEPGKWRTFGERVIWESAEVWVGQVDVGLPSRERVWRPVVRWPRTAAVLLLDAEDRALLVWRHRFIPDLWGWELPGGAVDEDEQPDEAALRELEEQTGYRAGRIDPLVTVQAAPDVADGERIVFVGRDGQFVGDPVSSEPIGRAEWVPVGMVPRLIAGGELWDATTAMALLYEGTGR